MNTKLAVSLLVSSALFSLSADSFNAVRTKNLSVSANASICGDLNVKGLISKCPNNK